MGLGLGLGGATRNLIAILVRGSDLIKLRKFLYIYFKYLFYYKKCKIKE